MKNVEAEASAAENAELPVEDLSDRTELVKGFDMAQAEHTLRKDWADKLIGIFKAGNIAMLLVVVIMAALDAMFIANGFIQPEDRVITEHVIFAGIAATVANVGAGAYAITRSLFGGVSKPPE